MKSSQDDAEQVKREQIPTIDDVPTLYRPLKSLLMVIPLPDIKQVGHIIIPERANLTMNEGHVVAKGPECQLDIDIGDCVTWDGQTENQMSIDGVRFLLVAEACCIMKITKEDLEIAAQTRADEKVRDIQS